MNTGDLNTGDRNTGDRNVGHWNTGDLNVGDRNTGDWNVGHWNTGDLNVGHWNTGDRNTGDRNTGNWNTGNWNTGDRNTGNWNTGNWNVGRWNTGDRNTGNWNTGNWNVGNWNTGNWNTGDLNTTTPTVRLFNKETTIIFNGEEHSRLRGILHKYSRPLCEWVSKNNMSKEEKLKNPTYVTTGGYLKVNKNRAKDIEVSQEDRDFLTSLPNFDNEILKECTGIDLEDTKVKIVVDGKEIYVTKECFHDIVEQFSTKG